MVFLNGGARSLHNLTPASVYRVSCFVCCVEVIAVRGGIGLGKGVYALKGLELSLAQKVAPHATTTEEGKVVGYDAIFRDTRYKNHEGDPIKREIDVHRA